MAEVTRGAPVKIRVLLLGLIATAGLALGWAAPASAEDWTVGEIAGPPGTTRVQPAAVNANAEVVGVARFAGRSEDTAFWWRDGTMIELPAPAGAERWRAYDINDNGLIVGFTLDEDTGAGVPAVNGVTWTVDEGVGAYQLTAYNLGGADDGGFREGSAAFGVNNAGQVVGRANYGWEHEIWGFRDVNVPTVGNGLGWTRLALPDVETETGSVTYGGRAFQINEDGLILGFGGPGGERARLWPGGGGTGTELSLFAGEQGLNDLGHVVGRSEDSNHKAVLWDGSGYEAIGAGQSKSMAHGVNDSDWAVGRAGTDYYQSVLTAGNAWLWRPDTAATPLYLLAPTGWSMYSAADINDDGMVVGTGKHGSEAVGFWMAPHGIAHELSGTVYGPDLTPVAGAKVRIVGGGGEVATPTTDADGHYAETLPRGSYEITVLPDGDYLPDGLAGCEIVASTCRLGLSRNRTVDFYGVDIEVPEVPPASPPGSDPGGGSKSSRLRVNGVTLSRSGTAAQLQLTVPGPGVVTTSQAAGGGSAATSRRRQQASSLLRTTRKRVRKAGRVKVTARLGRLGKRRLARRGKVAVRVRVTYKPQRGKPFSRTKRIVFKRAGA
ncbi:MAG: carboxypeptidase regulatory-like domain-containing protein [Solirubrobacterales bacterium]